MGCGTPTWCGQAEQKRHRRKSANEAENCLILLTRQASTKNAAPPRIPRPGQGSRREWEGGVGGQGRAADWADVSVAAVADRGRCSA